MEKQNIVFLVAVTVVITLLVWHRPSLWADEQTGEFKVHWDFENVAFGQISQGWEIESTFVSSGGIGLWTKADAVTVFDGLVINSEH